MPQGGRCRGHPAAVRLVRGAAVPGGARRRADPADAARGKGAPERLSGLRRIREAHAAPHPRRVVRLRRPQRRGPGSGPAPPAIG